MREHHERSKQVCNPAQGRGNGDQTQSVCCGGDVGTHLQEAIDSRNLSLFAHSDQSGEAKRIGLKIQEAHVLIFGSPKASTPLMIASPLLVLDLPLQALVWQGEDDQVWGSSPNSDSLRVRSCLPQELIGTMAGVDALIEQMCDRLTLRLDQQGHGRVLLQKCEAHRKKGFFIGSAK